MMLLFRSTSATMVTVEYIATVTHVCVPNRPNAAQNGDFDEDIEASAWELVDVSSRAWYNIITASHGDAKRVFHAHLSNWQGTDDPTPA